jgi:NB-ARC domain
MEPAALAAASLLAASTVDAQGGQAGTSVWAGQAQLAGLVRQAVTGRDLAVVLDDVDARPQDPVAVGALAQILAALAAQDRGFRGELARLVGQAEHDPALGQLATTIAGHARVGKLVTIGRAGQVHVHLPPPPAATVLDQLPPTRAGPLVANLPPRNPNFTGRADLLDQLHQRLHPGQPAAVVQVQAQALHGLGGVGKTQLALEYAHRHAGDYDLIWWVTAEPAAAIPGQLVALARRLGLPEQLEQAETVSVLWDALRQRDRWLLIFDNAEDPADLRPWWPPDSGRVLVTSRYSSWAGPASTLAIDVLPRTEAVAFLQHRLGRDDPDFNRLAEALGDLPLALEQAAAYLEETATTSADYPVLLATHARRLFALGRPTTTEQTIATIWSVSLVSRVGDGL